MTGGQGCSRVEINSLLSLIHIQLKTQFESGSCPISVKRNVTQVSSKVLAQYAAAAAKSLQSCPTVCDTIDNYFTIPDTVINWED